MVLKRSGRRTWPGTIFALEAGSDKSAHSLRVEAMPMPVPTHLRPAVQCRALQPCRAHRARPRRQPRVLRGHHRPASRGCRARTRIYFRGMEERNHHSLVLKRGPEPVAERLGFKVGSEEDLDRAHAFFKAAAAAGRVRRGAVPGAHAARHRHRRAIRSSCTSRSTRPSASCSSTAAIRGCHPAAHRSLQPVRRATCRPRSTSTPRSASA